MSIWAILIVMLFVLPLVLLSVPLAFRARGGLSAEEQRLNLKLFWGWGLLALAVDAKGRKTSFSIKLAGIDLPGINKKPKAERPKKKNPKKTLPKKRPGASLPPITSVLNRKMLAAVLGYLKRLLKSMGLKLKLRGIYGTDDPALTGLLTGVMAALKAEHYSLDLEPDFSGPIIDVSGETSGRVIPTLILWLTLRLILTKPVRRLWWALLKKKITRKKPKEDALYV